MTEPAHPAGDDARALQRPQGAEACAALAVRLLEVARERVRILAQRADLRYLATDEIVDALRAWLVQRQRARLEILLAPDVARDERGRPLWNLAQRLTSFVTVHRLGDEDAQFGEAWLTVDERGYLHRPQIERLEAQACLDNPSRARELNQRFASLWLASEPEPELRRLGA